ncbi:group II intron maturase-specific domain-containing protein (plasmid) [Microvirga sp. RSM25]|uniref:group II intron maturase-specific domain-containing protein n=1 Tax=Microvirga sp. RSM25 TaxID=3273802 RepID=UPI00384F9463
MITIAWNAHLGFTIRKVRNGKLLIMPEKAKVRAHLRAIKAYLDAHRQVPAGAVVRALTPMIRGWTLYYRHACSATTFAYLDHRVWQMLWAWARRRHPQKSRRWVKARYFRPTRTRVWNFADAAIPGTAMLPCTATPRLSATSRSRGAPAP